MKKTRDSITIYHDENSDDHHSEDENTAVNTPSSISKSPAAETVEDAPLNQSNHNSNDNDTLPIKLTSVGAVQLATSTNNNQNNAINPTSSNPTTNAILSLKQNPFYHDKRKWDDSFTLAEKKELTGNIVKAARDMEGGNLITLQEEEYTVPNLSHEEDDDSQESDDIDGSNKKPGRKHMADEEETFSDSDQDPKVKRKAQNRAAQRAFRERKERYVKELEAKIKQVQDTHLVATSHLIRENDQLRSIIYRLEAENYALKGIPMQPFQHQTVISPQQHQPPIQQQQRHNNNSSNGASSNFTNIAPLLPNTHQQQPLLFPSYLSNSPSASPILHPSKSPSVNHMMMLAQASLQQYPMSSVVTMSHGGSLNSSPSPTLSNNNHKIAMPPVSKKTSSRKINHHHQTPTPPPPPNNQPLEYTFSISTPDSLRPSGGAVSSSKHTRTEPVELVQLYPPSGSRSQHPNNNSNNNSKNSTTTSNDSSPSNTQQNDSISLSNPSNDNNAKKAPSVTSIGSPGSTTGNNNATAVTTPNSTSSGLHHQLADDNNSVMSDKTSSTVNTQQQRKKMQQLESDMYDCHIDPEGRFFCEKLHNEVCNDAFDRLLSEPLFDQMGKLNLYISSYPVPIVTGNMSISLEDQQQQESDENDNSTGGSNSNDEDNSNKQGAAIKEKEAKQNTESVVVYDTVSTPKSPGNTSSTSEQKRLLTCPEIWFLLNQHDKFSNYTTDQYCQAVKELAKCSDSGPVLEEADLHQIMSKMDEGYL